MSFPKYDSYKDSGVEWLGAVPVHWDAKRLRNIMSFSKGLTITKENLQDEGIPCVNYGEIHSKYGFRLNPTVHPLRCVAFDYLSSNPDALLRDGDFVFADTSEDLEGSGNFTNVRTDIPLFAGYHTIIGRPREYVFPLFLAFQLHSQFFRSQIQRQVKGIKVFSVSQAVLKSVKCWLPPPDEQRAISSFLDSETSKIDGLVLEQRRLIELLKEKRQAVISHAVTKGLNPNAPMKPSGIPWLGDVPAHWVVGQSRRLFALRNERAYPDDEQLTASQVHGVIPQEMFIELEGRRVVQVILNAEILKHVEPGDYVISMRSFQGGIEYATHRGCISSAYVILIPSKKVHGPFFKHLLKSQTYIQALQSTTNLVRDGQALRFQNFAMVDLPLVPLEEQKAIASQIDSEILKIVSLSAEAERAIALLQERRTALISAAVTGKIDVRNLARRTSKDAEARSCSPELSESDLPA